MESKLVTEILSFHLSLAKIKIQAQKIEDKLDRYSREWAQVNNFREKCKETQSVLIKFVDRLLKEKDKNKMRKKETIILLDKKQSYRIFAHGGDRIAIKPKLQKEMSSIGILGPQQKVIFKSW